MFLPAALLSIALAVPSASLNSLFSETSKDFGSVPHGSVSSHQFVLKNTTGSTIHLSGLRSSCHCAKPHAIKDLAQPGEEIIVEVKYDARLFVGSRSMTIYASFDQPHYETVSLRVSGVSRQDVIVEPGEVDLGTITRGAQARRQLRVEYAGQMDWNVVRVEGGEGVTAVIENQNRQLGRTEYFIDVAIDPQAAPGSVASYVQIHTNDSNTPVLTVPVTATVQAALSASPDHLGLGTIRIGDKISKRIIVRGNEPFAIESVSGASEAVKVSATGGSRTVHLVQVDVEATQSGDLDLTLQLNTDLKDDNTLAIRVDGKVNP